MRQQEKRRAPRAAHDSVLEFRDGEGRLTGETARLADFSARGARFSTPRAYAKGARVRGRIRLLERGVFEVTGRVVRLRERENFTLYGVEFDSCRRVPGRSRRAGLPLAVLLAVASALPARAAPRAVRAVEVVVAGGVVPADTRDGALEQPVRRALDTGNAAVVFLSGPPDEAGSDRLKSWGFRQAALSDAGATRDDSGDLGDDLKTLEDAGLRGFGAGADADSASEPLIERYRGRMIGFLAVNLSSPSASAAAGRAGVAFLDPDAAAARVSLVKAGCDKLVVFAAMSPPSDSAVPAGAERALARAAVAAGADAVVFQDGGGVRAAERVGGAVVLYGLGPFAAKAPGTPGTSAKIVFDADGTSVVFFPVESGGGRPLPASPAVRAKVRASLDALGALTQDPSSFRVSAAGR